MPDALLHHEGPAYSVTSDVVTQETLTERALELLALPDDGAPKLLLDLGCGSGLSGECLTKHGHTWVVSRHHDLQTCAAPKC